VPFGGYWVRSGIRVCRVTKKTDKEEHEGLEGHKELQRQNDK
jgi:hypothetical protein